MPSVGSRPGIALPRLVANEAAQEVRPADGWLDEGLHQAVHIATQLAGPAGSLPRLYEADPVLRLSVADRLRQSRRPVFFEHRADVSAAGDGRLDFVTVGSAVVRLIGVVIGRTTGWLTGAV